MKKFKLLRYIILKAATGVLLWKLADMNFWPQFLKITYGGVWSFPKGFSVILSTTFAKVFCRTAIFGIIASKVYKCYIIMIHIQFCFTFSFFLHFALVLYIFKFVRFFTKKIVLFNPFTSDLYLGFPFKKAHCFMGKNIVNVGDQRKDWISLEIYIQTVNKYIFLKSKINFVNFDWKINVAMATALNQSPPLKSYKKIA